MKDHPTTLIEAARAAPTVGVGALAIADIPLSDWVIILTLIYTIFLLIDKLPVVFERIKQFVSYLKGLRK